MGKRRAAGRLAPKEKAKTSLSKKIGSYGVARLKRIEEEKKLLWQTLPKTVKLSTEPDPRLYEPQITGSSGPVKRLVERAVFEAFDEVRREVAGIGVSTATKTFNGIPVPKEFSSWRIKVEERPRRDPLVVHFAVVVCSHKGYYHASEVRLNKMDMALLGGSDAKVEYIVSKAQMCFWDVICCAMSHYKDEVREYRDSRFRFGANVLDKMERNGWADASNIDESTVAEIIELKRKADAKKVDDLEDKGADPAWA